MSSYGTKILAAQRSRRTAPVKIMQFQFSNSSVLLKNITRNTYLSQAT